MRSVTVLYSLLVSICGPKLTEMLNGANKEYYEGVIEHMKEMAQCAWDPLLNQKFDETRGTNHEGIIIAFVKFREFRIGDSCWHGALRRAGGDLNLFVLTKSPPDASELYFSSKDILVVEISTMDAVPVVNVTLR